MKGSLKIALNADEEPGSPESRRYLPSWLEGADWAFVCEPAAPGGTLVTRRKGVGIFRLSVKGKAAHAGSEPDKGVNAIEELIRKLIEIIRLADPKQGTTVNVGTIEGGQEPYIVPDSAKAAVDIRVANLEEQKRIEQGINKLVASSFVKGTSVSVQGGFHRPPMEPIAGTERLKQVVREAGATLGYNIDFTVAPRGGASDGNLIVTHGIPCIDGMGPVGSGAHSEEEFIELDSLYEKAKLLALVLDKLLCG